MQKFLLLAALFGLAQLGTSCQTDADVRPANYDVLALGTGHWEWESTAYMAGNRTPATEGYTRQLVFNAEGQVLIQHSGQLHKETPYQLSMGSGCVWPGSPTAGTTPIIAFEGETTLYNNLRKNYTLTKVDPTQKLQLTGESACVDGGAYETYHWVAE